MKKTEPIYSGPGRPCTMTGSWGEFVHVFGTVKAAAEDCGAATRTFHQWVNGTRTPRGPAKKALQEKFLALGIALPAELE